MRHQLLLIAISILTGIQSLYAQQTQYYTEDLAKYKEAIEFFDRENYLIAQEMLFDYTGKAPAMYDKKHETAFSHAKYLIAVCAVELFQPDAEKLLVDFINSSAYDNADKRMAYYHLGRYYFRDRQYAKAVAALKKVDQSDLNSEEKDEYKFLLAYCYFFKKDFNNAYNLFRQIKDKTNKYYYPANYYYGYISFTKGKYTDAINSFDRIGDSKAYQRIIPYYKSQILFKQGEYDQVITYLKPRINDNHLSYYAELNLTLGQSYFEKGQYKEALPYLEEYHNANKKVYPEDIYQLGYCYYKTGDYNNAIRQFEYMDDQKDSLGQHALFLLADSYLKTKNNSKARTAFAKAGAINADQTIAENAQFNYAKLSYQMNFNTEAVNALEEFINKYPSSSYNDEAKELLSELFLSAKDYDKALSIIESITNKTPDIKKAYQIVSYNRGIQLFNDGDYNGALNMFETSLKYPVLAEYKAMAYYWKGESLYALGDYQKANWQYAQYMTLSKDVDAKDRVRYEVLAHYGAGYGYLKRKDYPNAATYFEKTIAAGKNFNSPDISKRVVPDAMLRAGDCYYLTRDYTRAINYYDMVVSAKHTGADYAMYQTSLLKGLQGNSNSKINGMLDLQRQFPQSKYADAALFEAATTYFETGQKGYAVSTFNKLISTYPNSAYLNEAHLKLGLVYYNEQNYNKALQEYEQVLGNSPSSEDGKAAFSGIQDIAIATNDKNLVAKMAKKYPGWLDQSDTERLNYEFAESQYAQGNYAAALERFNEYLNNFPNGAFVLNAHFYRGECYYVDDKFSEALADYTYVLDNKPNRFVENALVKYAQILYFYKKDYAAASQAFKQLLDNTESDYNKHLAYIGIVRCAYRAKDYSEVIQFANNVLNYKDTDPNEILETQFYLGRSYFEQETYSSAKPLLEKIAETNSARGAESAWDLAFILYKNGKYDESLDACYAIINDRSSYGYWVVKSYILLADNYYAQENIFQAKATLQSIVDNYAPEDELKQEAREKLQAILDAEGKQNKIIEPGDTTENLVPDDSQTIDLNTPEQD